MRESKYTKELLEPIIKSSITIAEVLKKLGLKQSGGMQTLINTKIKNFNIDISHFKGQSWSKDQNYLTNQYIIKQVKSRSKSDEEIFIQNSIVITSLNLRNRLLRKGWEYKCKICGISEWLNNKITLHIDHINGVHNDNRLENLRFLCPNCHQQTETWGNKTQQIKCEYDETAAMQDLESCE